MPQLDQLIDAAMRAQAAAGGSVGRAERPRDGIFAGLIVSPASRFGSFLHLGTARPSPRRFVPPTMELPRRKQARLRRPNRLPGEPYGGFWTSPTRTDPWVFARNASFVMPASIRAGRQWYRLAAEPDAP